ncbi:glycosyl hydrolase family 28-related protein [Corallococcus sp. M7]
MGARKGWQGLLGAGLIMAVGVAEAAPWRSVLYPSTWTPGYSQPGTPSRFLHDFSYAGYRMRQAEPPVRMDRVLDVTQAPYFADNTGASDVTAVLQQALDDAGAVAGGGVVYLPRGTYRVAPPAGKPYALLIRYSNVVLRGQGATSTFLYNSATDMRSKRVVQVSPRDTTVSWTSASTASVALTQDAPNQATRIQVASVSGYTVGTWVVVRADLTATRSAELNMGTTWTSLPGPSFYRQVVAVDSATRMLTLDIPLRQGLLMRDNARVYRVPAHLSEVGVEHLAIGMRENPTPGMAEEDYTVQGRGAYEVHESTALLMNHVVDGWVRGVSSYRPPSNTQDVHVTSNGIDLNYARNITVEGCEIDKPQYKGGGGNGYLYSIRGSDSLVKDSVAYGGRHNFDFRSMHTTGNVLFNNRVSNGEKVSDFHMHLSAANLVDNTTLYQERFEAADRSPYGTTSHGVTTTESVFWNTNGAKAPSYGGSSVVRSQQYGQGYVIGMRGSATGVDVSVTTKTAPADFSEVTQSGNELVPQSLYVDQTQKRLGRAVEHDARALVYQAENLKPTSTPDPSSTGVEAGPELGGVRYHNTSAVGAKVTYTLYPRTVGTFAVRVRTKRNSGRGQYRLDVNGVAVGGTRDEYSATTQFAEVELGTVTFTDLEPQAFTFTTVGKNAASTGYNVALDVIRLVRQ